MPETLGKTSVLGVVCIDKSVEKSWKCYKNVTFESAFDIWDFLMDIIWKNGESGFDGVSEMLEKSMDLKVWV